MKLTNEQLKSLLKLAVDAAEQAGGYIRAVDREDLHVNGKSTGSSLSTQVVTDVDLACEKIILSILQPTIEQYSIAMLSEENAYQKEANQHARLTQDYFWCVDPLDGTLPFIEGVDGFAVSIALVERSGYPLIGVVHNPITGKTYQALNEPLLDSSLGSHYLKSWQECTLSLPGSDSLLSFFTDRSFESHPLYAQVIEKLEMIAEQFGYQGVRIVVGQGAVMSAIGVLEHAPACYFKFPKEAEGGGSLWDFSATAACAISAKAWVTNIHGQALDLNRKDSNFMNHQGVIYASDPLIAQKIMDLYKSIAC
ncbi:inositol-1-monophosphatase [Vibrio sp. Of7-15]|uniref:3'(2'),5'-bisphosphate nucleotidase CysQ family protein n=1 Tax=Vibrio sp. Of7-15 TaxID=2724879 RepID=UPI001EF2A0CC|nr:inositol monophosphatase family protein [Vibrio sp. Of7-15]MCG7499456.1 inositol-1-monophosphatase [Vibrio sp. Of7-15]